MLQRCVQTFARDGMKVFFVKGIYCAVACMLVEDQATQRRLQEVFCSTALAMLASPTSIGVFCPFLHCSLMVLTRFSLCWHASQCPWHRRGRCLFRHRDDDAGVKPPMTRKEEEIGAELAALWAAVSKMASSLMWRTGQKVDVPVPQVMEEPAMNCVLPGCG